MDYIEKCPGPLLVKFNSKRTPVNLCEVDNQFIEKCHVKFAFKFNLLPSNLKKRQPHSQNTELFSSFTPKRRLVPLLIRRCPSAQPQIGNEWTAYEPKPRTLQLLPAELETQNGSVAEESLHGTATAHGATEINRISPVLSCCMSCNTCNQFYESESNYDFWNACGNK